MDAMTKLLAAVLACVLVSACGGYLQDEAAAVPTECPVVGQALDTGGARLEGVAVTVQLDGARHEAVSDAAGRWRIVMPAAYPYPTQFAGAPGAASWSFLSVRTRQPQASSSSRRSVTNMQPGL